MLVFPSNPDAGEVFAPGPGFPSWIWDGDKWTNTGPSGGALSGLPDVSIHDLMHGQMLTWDDAIDKWVNSAPPAGALAALTDVALIAPAAGQPLTYDGTHWHNGGALVLAADPATALGAATKQYVDTTVGNAIAAIPTPSTSLAGLSDTSLANLAAGQALTWTGSAWTNANVFSPVTINSASGSTSLSVTAAAGQSPLDVWRPDPGSFFHARDTTSGIWFGVKEESDYVVADVGNAPNGFCLRVQNHNALYVNNIGSVAVTGGSNSASDYVFRVANSDAVALLNIFADGSGEFGKSGSWGWSWTGQGNWTLWPPPGGTTLEVRGAAYSWAGEYVGAAVWDYSYGLSILSGTSVNDYCLLCRNYNAGANRFVLRGDGSGALGNGGFALTFDSWGSITIPAGPGPSQRLTLFGNDGAWAEVINATEYGLYIKASYTPIACYNQYDQQLFRLWGNGNGSLGPPPGRLEWDDNGNFILGPCSYGVALSVRGGNTGTWTQNILATTAASASYGLWISAGTNSNDFNTRFWNASSSAELFAVRGDGFTFMPLSASATVTGVSGNMYRSSNMGVYLITSSARYKHDVRTITPERAREIIRQLRAVSFRSKCEGDDPDATYYGFIAEEVAAVDPALASFDADGKPQGVQYDRIAMLMLPIMQEFLEKERC